MSREVGRQEEEPAPSVAHCLGSNGILVGDQIVWNDHGAGGQLWHQHLLDISSKDGTVHRSLDDLKHFDFHLRRILQP